MITLILAYINSKFDTQYELLFLGTLYVDLELIRLMAELLFGECQ